MWIGFEGIARIIQKSNFLFARKYNRVICAGIRQGVVVTLTDTLNMVRIQRTERRIFIRIIRSHPHDDTVFQSPGNLGIMAG